VKLSKENKRTMISRACHKLFQERIELELTVGVGLQVARLCQKFPIMVISQPTVVPLLLIVGKNRVATTAAWLSNLLHTHET